MQYIVDQLELNASVIERLKLLPLEPGLLDAAQQLIAMRETLEALGCKVSVKLAPLEITLRKPRGFEPLHRDYWLKTFPKLNPFEGTPYCPRCKFLPAFQRSWDKYGGAVTVYEFKCVCGHEWQSSKTND